MFRFRKILIMSLLVIAISAISSISVQGASEEQALPRERLLGDNAFKDRVYDLAITFYKQYKEKSAGNANALLDASKCLIAAYLYSGNAQQAREELNYVTTKFAERIAGRPELRHKLTFWDGNILMEAGDPSKAAGSFRNLLKSLPPGKSELKLKTRDGLGTAYARSLQWDKAEKAFAELEVAGSGTKWQAIAIRKKILAIIMMGDYKQAELLIRKNRKTGKIDIEVLRGILLMKKGYLDNAMTHYKELRKSASGQDPLWYMLASSFADALYEKKDYKNALLTLNDALLFAGSEFERQRTLVRIINAAVSDGNLKAAISTAERFLKNYPNSFLSNEIRLKLAQLYANKNNPEKKPDDAIQVLTTMINDKSSQIVMKLKSAREAAHIYINLKRFAASRDMFQYMIENGTTSSIKGEGAYWTAQLEFMQEQYKQASESFAAVASVYPEWREKALFKEIKALISTTDYKTTLQRLELFLKSYPKSKYASNCSFLYAVTLKNAGENKKAIAEFANFAKLFPAHVYAPRALFEEGILEMKTGRYQDAILAFTQLYKKYPNDPLVPNALYRRIYGLFWEGLDKDAIDDVNLLMAKYPNSEYAIYAQFRLAEYYRDQQDIGSAIVALNVITSKYASTNHSAAARAYYEIADIYFYADDKAKAFSALDELSANFGDQPVSHNALFLRGEIFTQNNEYEKAIPFYTKVAKAVPDTLLAAAAIGRTGDCYFALGKKAKDGVNYTKAVELYNQVLTYKDLPPFYRDQAHFKIGLSEEEFGNRGEALLKFHKVMISYNIDNKLDKATARSSVWFAKSAIKAANLYLKKDNPEAAEAAIAIYKTLIKAGIEPIKDFKKKIDIIQNRYKLKE